MRVVEVQSNRYDGSRTYAGCSEVCRLTASDTLETAFKWLSYRRQDWPDHADVWGFRAGRAEYKTRIQRDIRSGTHKFSLLNRVRIVSGEIAHLWAARDAVVLKALALVLADVLPTSKRCTHIKGHDGLKDAVCQTTTTINTHSFVFKTDVKSYYDSIDHGLLIERLKRHIRDERSLGLLRRYLHRTSEGGSIFHVFEKRISRGCPLSPLIGAFLLNDLDERMAYQAKRDCLFYVRYMDDILVLAPTRWKLRRAIRTINEELAALQLSQHPDKTFVVRIARRFDFLGYRFGSDGIIGFACQTWGNFEAKLSRLYEQWQRASRQRRLVLEGEIQTYIDSFERWATGGLHAAQKIHFRIFGRDPVWFGCAVLSGFAG